MKVIEFASTSPNIIEVLRDLAADIESKKLPEPDTLAIVTSGGEGLTAYGAGRHSRLADIHHLTLSAALHALRNDVIGGE